MRGMRGATEGLPAAAVAVLVTAAAAAAWLPADPGGPDPGLRCGGIAAPQCAAAQQSARMSIAVTLADDVLAMGDGGVHLRGDVAVHNYDPREGHLFQEIRAEPSGRVVSKSKIFTRTGSGGEWVAQVGAVLRPEDYPPGGYSIGVVTESGLRSPRAAFAVSAGPAGADGAAPLPPPQRPPDGPPAALEPIADAVPAEVAGMLQGVPAGISRLDVPAELPELPELPGPDDAAPAPSPDAVPLTPAADIPAALSPSPAPALPSMPASQPAPAAADPPDPDSGILGHLAGLLTASYLVTIIVSVIISFAVMFAVRTAIRRAMRRRASRAPRAARRP